VVGQPAHSADQEVIVRMAHIRACGLCANGVREWFRANGHSWPDFVANGIPASKLTVDAMSERVIEVATRG